MVLVDTGCRFSSEAKGKRVYVAFVDDVLGTGPKGELDEQLIELETMFGQLGMDRLRVFIGTCASRNGEGSWELDQEDLIRKILKEAATDMPPARSARDIDDRRKESDEGEGDPNLREKCRHYTGMILYAARGTRVDSSTQQ
eukprot:GHVN01101194.1.p1 GENE.GHVN01101194.1~~GHVN01101194.1.p1  ORF type:complete len:142 (+),score=11.37 GHVN01101194.1:252-677(+)